MERADNNLIYQRNNVIRERRAALARWLHAKGKEQKRIFLEFIQPLNEQLNHLNKILGL